MTSVLFTLGRYLAVAAKPHVEGIVAGADCLEVTSEMNDTGVIFGDGIEGDALSFGWGQTAWIGCADRTLNLVRA